MQTAADKSFFFQRNATYSKAKQTAAFADVFKKRPMEYCPPVMQTMLNGWAMSDILSISELEKTGKKFNFALTKNRCVPHEVIPSIKRLEKRTLGLPPHFNDKRNFIGARNQAVPLT
jgi:hypothetical protein